MPSIVSMVCRYGSQMLYWPVCGNGVIISRWSRVSPSSTTPSSRPGCPFRVQIAPVIEAATRNREICSQRRMPPCPSMASVSRSFIVITLPR
jgi:hypothetical protein